MFIPNTSPLTIRSMAAERVSAVAHAEGAESIRGSTGEVLGGWVGNEGKTATGVARKSDAALRLEQRLELRERAAARQAEIAAGEASRPEVTASIRRKIQFLEECDRYVVTNFRSHLYAAVSCNTRPNNTPVYPLTYWQSSLLYCVTSTGLMMELQTTQTRRRYQYSTRQHLKNLAVKNPRQFFFQILIAYHV